MTNKIKFIYPKDWEDYLKDVMPTPIKTNIPEWYKKLKHDLNRSTVKGCMPFLDTLTSGYLFKLPQDFGINHNYIHPKTLKRDSGFCPSIRSKRALDYININTSQLEAHPIEQLKGSPLIEKNKNLPFYKFLNPFIIKTPPGYSCLFLSPMNNRDDRFEIIPGIVDTDTFEYEINFPFVINGDKYETLETVIERGTPIAQIIPFKRESWEMEIEGKKNYTGYTLKGFQLYKKIINNYKTFLWRKKSWK